MRGGVVREENRAHVIQSRFRGRQTSQEVVAWRLAAILSSGVELLQVEKDSEEKYVYRCLEAYKSSVFILRSVFMAS